jgi:L-seryl-tRNA(Ser) seleniumtransferase
LLAEAVGRLERAVARTGANDVRRVVNATGVILHTNLGRAPLSEAARRAVAEEAAGYCTLEYDLETGARGRRGGRAEDLLAELTGAEAALVVNNCAAAALLVLSTLARDGETIVSRGELVEIGGDFRVPDVMAESGTRMIEVGTTNRTKLTDYERAITTETRLILRVHPSNYRIVGFTAAPALVELCVLAHARDLPVYEDAGSGALLDLGAYDLDEPVIRESIRQGADIVTFSGDKLLGATQAGLVVGRRALVERCRRNPLYRALRADKLALAALAATLDAHARGATFTEVPALRMLAATRDDIEKRARAFLRRARARLDTEAFQFEIIAGQSAVGGGSAPTTHPPTALIAVTHKHASAAALEAGLRQRARPPVIARILDGRVVLDLRTVAAGEEAELLDALCALRDG